MDTAVEIGHIFKLGQKYTTSMGARVLDKNGKEVTPIMGSYGIGIERILTAAVEQSNDENGFWLPPQIAPFEIIVTPTNVGDEKIRSTAEDIASRLEAAGYDVLLDDRDERPGSSSRTPIWSVSPLESTSERRLPKILWRSFSARLVNPTMLASAQSRNTFNEFWARRGNNKPAGPTRSVYGQP